MTYLHKKNVENAEFFYILRQLRNILPHPCPVQRVLCFPHSCDKTQVKKQLQEEFVLASGSRGSGTSWYERRGSRPGSQLATSTLPLQSGSEE